MRPEDEISVDSIISALLSQIEPTEVQFRECQWDVTAKEMHNEKQALLFEEKLYISQVKTGPCKLNEENKTFLESELNEVGYMKLNIEESYDGYVVFSRSQMAKGTSKSMCGHCLRGKYNDKFFLIAEKRCEFDYIDKARIVSAQFVLLSPLIIIDNIKYQEKVHYHIFRITYYRMVIEFYQRQQLVMNLLRRIYKWVFSVLKTIYL